MLKAISVLSDSEIERIELKFMGYDAEIILVVQEDGSHTRGEIANAFKCWIESLVGKEATPHANRQQRDPSPGPDDAPTGEGDDPA